ncbi:hypothetical protein [Methylococcus capsulatus]|uniref:hypothetical protein n=1 Tax=Methylococcus capsulatus TaxID=414 RepID=UPI0002F3B375|nr:hypothetical protein [Methylococcus capsulatus]
MGKHLKNLLDGAWQVLVMWPESDYVRPSRGDFGKDSDNLRANARRIARGLRDNVKKKKPGKAYDGACA